ncbi:MAG: cbb3-type cytochrome c oxidase subunit 3 [Gammaproteobacteria bacterium]|nr:cbb3-type cytochrome c oxidase subunit 3 [Gammaproteobacteria bacterium]
MAVDDLRGVATLLCMLAFLAVVWWAYAPSRKKRFESASMIPFADSQEVENNAPVKIQET